MPLFFIGECSGLEEVIVLFKDILKGSPFYHMWYMYMIMGVYCLAPIVIEFKNSISYTNFRRIVVVFFVLTCVSRWTTQDVMLSWDLGQVFEYMGYFMMGYVIKRDIKKSSFKAIVFIILGFGVLLGASFLQYKYQMVYGIAENELKFKVVSPHSPLVVIAMLFIFAGFGMMKIGRNKCIEKMSNMSFVIYLIHAGVWDILTKIIYFLKGEDYLTQTLNNIYWIPIFVLVVLMVSVLFAFVYKYIGDYLKKKMVK